MTGDGTRRKVRGTKGSRRRTIDRPERLEGRVVLANAIPVAMPLGPAQALIGSTVDFSVGFSNASPTQAGYGPYVDLEMPATGADGNDGITFGSATYLGSAVTSTVLTFDAMGHATHPYAEDNAGHPVVVDGTPGDQLVVLQLPFGSVTPGQPTATISVTAALSNKARVNDALNIKVDGGFRYGNDPLDNPTVDPSLIGASTTYPVTPTLVVAAATYLGPEQETATGPNFKEQYLISAVVAPGQTINGFSLTDLLPSNLQFVSLDAESAQGSATHSTTSTPSLATPGGTLTEGFDKVVGTGGASDVPGTTIPADAWMKFTFYAPRDDASHNPVLDLSSGAFATSVDQADAQGTWTPLNASESTTAVTSNLATDTLTDKSLAVQKTVVDLTHPGAPEPGDVLAYTINFQVSDFFAFANLMATDVFSDGQHLDTTFAPTLAVNQHGTSLSASAIGAGDLTIGSQNTTDGTTTLGFNLSAELAARGGGSGQFLGGSIPQGGTGGGEPSATPSFGGTTGSIVFHTVIQQQYDYNHPAGQPYVVEGDLLTNTVSAAGNVLAYANLAAGGSSQSDGSGTAVEVRRGMLSETIYAINGNTSFTSPPKIAAGDRVTYRIQYDLSTSNIDDMSLSSFLPLPVFDATQLTTFDDVTGSSAPAVGHFQFGPADTYHAISGIVPTVATSGTANSLTLDYGTYHDPSQRTSVVDVLYTVVASNNPFADGLFLTNQAHEYEGSTNNGTASADAIVQVLLTEPSLAITKGAVAVDNPNAKVTANPYGFTAPGSSGVRFSGTIDSAELGTSPVDGTASKFDAGDKVTFATVIQNLGSGLNGAFNVTLKDLLPAGFDIPAGGINLSVSDGSGTVLSYTNVGGGTGLFDQGIEVVDPNGSGSLAAYSATGGKNVLVVTYDLVADSGVTPGQSITDTAKLTNFSATEGGPDFLTSPEAASSTSTVAPASMTKALTATNQAFTTGNNLAIGEVATYDVTITLPEGVTPSAQLLDTLPGGLAIVGVDSITPSSGNLTSSSGTWASILASGVTIGANGSSATFALGTITNADRNNGIVDTITIQYRVVALDVASNTQGKALTNSAAFTYAGGSAAASAPAVVVTPFLKLTTTANKASAQAGDTVTYSVTIANASSNGSGANAFNVAFADALPAGLTYVGGSLHSTSGAAITSSNVTGQDIAVNFAEIDLGVNANFTFQATVDSTTGPYETLADTDQVAYTSISDATDAAQSTYNTTSTERTGNTSNPGGSANNLSASNSVNLSTVAPALSKVILSTNLPSLSGNNVTIGEEVTYQVTVTVPDGISRNATLVDTLPAGLAIVGVVSIGASGDLDNTGGGGFNPGTPTVGAGGDSLSFNFGTIVNSNRDSSNPDTIVVTYTTVVLNSAGNQAGASLQNDAAFAVQGGSVAASAPKVTIAMPKLSLAVTSDKATAQAGDTVTYTVTLANTAGNGSASDAYDVSLTDMLPPGMTYVPNSLAKVSGPAPTTLNGSGSSPVVGYNDLPLGSTGVFTFQALLQGSTGPYEMLTDTANVAYSTLPGAVTSPQSTYNAASTERTGSSSDPGGSLNNLDASGSASLTTVLPVLNKVLTGTSLATTTGGNVAVGEDVHYQVTITVPDGTTTNAMLVDSLPAGLAIVSLDGLTYSSTLSSSQASGFAGVQASASVGAGGSSLSLNFGTITNSNTDSSQTQTIVVSYTAVVLDAPSDVAGATLTNSATFSVQGGSTHASTPVTVVEPHVGVSLTSSATTGDAGGPAITFTIVVSANAGTGADAYGVALSDVLPVGYSYVVGSLAKTGGLAPTTLSDANGTIAAVFADMAPGATSTLTFRATLSGNTTPGQVVADAASLAYASLPGQADAPQTPNNPASTGRTGNPSDPGGVLNDYDASSSTSVTVNSNTVAGVVFLDANDDGVKAGGESGLSGVSVVLTGRDNLGNAVSTSTTTGGSGSYSFGSLRPGTYAVSMTPPSGDLDGIDTAGTPFGGSSPSPDLLSGLTIPLGVNAAGSGYNFAELLPASIAGTVFSDANNNGAIDGGEPGIAGTTITLTGTDDLGHSVDTTQTTGGSGQFQFGSLRPGHYSVVETQPSGYLQGKNAAGNTGGTLTGDALSGITLVEGSSDAGVTYGELLPASLSGLVFLDANDDGIRQGGEAGLGNVTVTLTGTDDLGHAVDTAVSTVDGSYTFAGLRPGHYAIAESTPAGDLGGTDTVGTQGGVVAAQDQLGGITLNAGTAGAGNDFAVLAPAGLSGYVYLDANDSGARQGGSPGLGGVTITLAGTDDRDNPVHQTLVTGPDGSFSIAGLRPGTYSLTEAAPGGYLAGQVTAGTAGGSASTALIAGIPLAEGVSGAGNDFGELTPAALSGYVYLDANADGLKEGGEAGLSGITVNLTGTDDHDNPVALNATTDGTGAYSFANLRPGTYALHASQPGQYTEGVSAAGTAGGTAGADSVTSITLTPGLDGSGNDFGQLGATIAGTAFLDANADGVRQGGEAGLSGIAVTLEDTSGNVLATTVTSPTGSYSFANLASGSYKLVEAAPAGYGSSTSNPRTVGLPLGGLAGQDFGSTTSSISGTVFVDGKDDGAIDGTDAGLAGATVYLSGTDVNGSPVHASATTTDGTFRFAGLLAGTYVVSEVPPSGYLDGKDGAGNSGGNANNDQVAGISLGAGRNPAGLTFAELVPSGLAGTVYDDLDDSGVAKAGDPGIGGVAVLLTGTDDRGGTVRVAATTASDGTYSFAGLRPGTYTLTETPPSGYLDGAAAAGTLGGSAGTDLVASIVVAPARLGTSYNFGNIVGSGLSGSVFEDANDDGIRQGGEAGLPGVTVTLTGTDDRAHPVTIAALTGSGGSYSFAGLRPGHYSLTEAPPSGYFDGKDAAGSLGGTPGADQVSSIAVGPGQGGVGYTFGELLPASVCGSVFVDPTNSGVECSCGTEGLAGVTVTLTGTDDNGKAVDATATTASDGTYSFPGLRPGTYTLTETPPAGYLDGKDAAGTLGGTVGTDQVGTIHVAAGNAGTGYTFAELKPSAFSGSVYLDANDDGTRQPAEAGLAGLTVTLTGTDDGGKPVDLTATTASDGTYSFPSLRPGTYTLTEAPPAGDFDGKDAAGSPGGTVGTDQVSSITIGPGAAGTGYTFAELAPSSLSGSVYIDANGDGTRQAGEPGLSGVTIGLAGTNDRGTPIHLTATTDGTGAYTFAGLRPGTYALTETRPGAYSDGHTSVGTSGGSAGVDSVANIGLMEGIAGSNYLFAVRSASIAGTAFLDAVGDGIERASSIGLAGLTVTLEDGSGAVVGVATTAGDGSYSFANLPAGHYTVVETPPIGYGRSTPASFPLSLTTAGVSGVNFGSTASALSGFVYLDANDDGLKGPGEPGLAGATVTLTGTDAAGRPVSRTEATALDGSYSFPGLLSGHYAIAGATPAGDLAGQDAAGPLGGTVGAGQFTSIDVGAGVAGPGYDFAELRPGTVSGSVFADSNDDGTRQGGEPGISGVALNLTGSDDRGNPVSLATTTALDGTYAFAGLRPGTYALSEAAPAGYLDGRVVAGPGGGTPAGRGDVGIELAGGGSAAEDDFAELAPASVAGLVYDDASDAGALRPGDPGLGGVSVALGGTDDLGRPTYLTTTTALDGSFRFAGLRPGSYNLLATTPKNWSDGKDAAGTQGGLAGGDLVKGFTLRAGQSGVGNDFGEVGSSSVSGTAYGDMADSGVLQPGDPGLAGVTVTLGGFNDLGAPVLMSTVTDASGNYLFNPLRPGTYSVQETTPGGWFPGRGTPGTAGGSGSLDLVTKVNLTPCVNANSYNFANVLPAMISGFAYLDASDSGVARAGDPPLPGATISLAGTDDLGAAVQLATTTAADGSYAFPTLRPGTYNLVETPPAGYANSGDVAGAAGGLVGPDTIGAITLHPASLGSGYLFAQEGSTVAGSVFEDLNGDGVREPGEPGIAGAIVTLYDGYQVMGTAITGPDGTYRFANLPAARDTLIVNRPNPDGTRAVSALAVAPAAGATAAASVAVDPDTGVLGGVVYADLADAGTPAPGDKGLGGVVVNLGGVDAQGRQVVRSTTTNAAGAYAFGGLPAGTYDVAETLPAGYLASKTGATSVNGVVLGQGQSTYGIPLAALPPAALAGVVYLDANRDGAYNPNEFGIAHATITLVGVDDLGRSTTLRTTTDAYGQYAFAGLRPGRYAIDRTPIKVFTTGSATAGILGGSATPLAIKAIPLGAGQPGTGYDFGEQIAPGCILNAAAFKAVLASGPHPEGPVPFGGGPGTPPTASSSQMAEVSYYLPTLIGELEAEAAGSKSKGK